MSEQKSFGAGVVFAVSAFSFWGFAPIYFKAADFISAWEITAHRVLWSLLLLAVVLLLRDGWRSLRDSFLPTQQLKWLLLSSVLIATNWTTFVWATTHERILETSLGYFINPLVNVMLGMLFFGERLRLAQWVAVVLAGVSTSILVVGYGQVPWVSLLLAFSFGFYGLVRKRTDVGSVPGLYVESAIIAPIALAFLALLHEDASRFGLDQASFMNDGAGGVGLLLLAGPMTVIPLLCFGSAARRLPLAVLGLFQYLAPSFSFLLAVFVYGETFTRSHLLTFSGIWLALLIFSVDMVRHTQRQRRAQRAERVPEAAQGMSLRQD